LEGRFVGLPAVMFPLMMQNREMFQSFVGANADLNAPGKKFKSHDTIRRPTLPLRGEQSVETHDGY